MTVQRINNVPSIEALRSQLRRIAAHRKICTTLSTSDLDQFCELAESIFLSFNFERKMRLARKTSAERAARRSQAASKKALEKTHQKSEVPQ